MGVRGRLGENRHHNKSACTTTNSLRIVSAQGNPACENAPLRTMKFIQSKFSTMEMRQRTAIEQISA